MYPSRRERRSRSRATSRCATKAPKPRRAKPRHRPPAWAQSLELLKIAVHVTIASVLYMRELLPSYAFGDRCLGKAKVGRMYAHEDFLANIRGTSPRWKSGFAREKKFAAAAEAEKPHASKYGWVKMIERGMDEVGDELRDALHEIFDGLARGRLQILELHVKEGNDLHEGMPHMLETYTMSFDYGGKRGMANDLDGSVDTVLKPRALRDIRKHIYNMSRKLSMLQNTPAPLNYRKIGLVLVYNEDSHERTAGWAFSSPSANTDRRGVQSSKLDRNWSNITQDGGRFDTGYHVTEFKLRYFQCPALVPFCSPAEPIAERTPRPRSAWIPAGLDWSRGYTKGRSALCPCHWLSIYDCPNLTERTMPARRIPLDLPNKYESSQVEQGEQGVGVTRQDLNVQLCAEQNVSRIVFSAV